MLHLGRVSWFGVSEYAAFQVVLGDLVEPGGVFDDFLCDEGVVLSEDIEVDLHGARVVAGLPGEEVCEEALVFVEL